MQVTHSDSLDKRSFPGRAKAASEVNRSFRVSGPLVDFPVVVGSQVKQGDLLARIDPRPFENNLSNLQGQLAREKAGMQRAQADHRRILSTFRQDPGAVSQAAIDRAKQESDAAQASVRALEASVKDAEEQLSYTYLQAPFDGIVVETFVENFETVMAKQPILRLLDPSQMEFTLTVPENLIGLATEVSHIEVTFDALPSHTFSATISKIGIEASQSTRTYPVTLLLDESAQQVVFPGMAGQASISSKPEPSSSAVNIDVPATAVFSLGDLSQSYVWVVDKEQQQIQRRAVSIDQLTHDGMQLSDGLQPGEWIVTKGVNSLQDEQPIRILTDNGGRS